MNHSSPRSWMTLALMTWNHDRFIEDAFLSALAQDYSPLEIIVSDDASQDGTWAIVERLAAAYQGPHRLRLQRNAKNLGVGAHCDLVLGMAQAELVVLAAGDDISEPGRVSAINRAWQKDPKRTLCLASYAVGIDERGERKETLAPCTFGTDVDACMLAQTGEALLGATLAVHKRLFETFGPIGGQIRACEDIILPFRAALLGKVEIIDEVLVRYRRHGASLQASSGPFAQNAEKYRAGFLQMVTNQAAARQRQLTDLATVQHLGLIDSYVYANLIQPLREHLALETLYVDLLNKRKGSVAALLRRTLAGKFTIGAAAKMMLAAFAGDSWYRYQRWRSKQSLSRVAQ